MDDLVAIARIVKARGLKGELASEILTDFPNRFEGLINVTAVLPDARRLDLKIEKFWFQNERIILKFAGYDSIETAEKLRGAEICINETEAVDLSKDEYFDWQLVGCEIRTINGELIGTVREVMRTGGTEILIVAGDLKERLIPFAGTICIEVDIENKVIVIDPPEGLLDF